MEIIVNFFDFSNWRDGVVINWDKEVVRGGVLGINIEILILTYVRCLNGDVKKIIRGDLRIIVIVLKYFVFVYILFL